MTETTAPISLSVAVPRAREMFPVLNPAQTARIAAHGRLRQVEQGEVLVKMGDPGARFFVVIAGQVELLRRSATGDELFAFEPGMFTGEVNILSGRRAFVEIRATGPAQVIELDRERLLTLVQTDSELSDILMRAFILRRVEIIAQGAGDVVVLGSDHCAGTLRVRSWSRSRQAARPALAPRSKTTWVFRPAYRAMSWRREPTPRRKNSERK